MIPKTYDPGNNARIFHLGPICLPVHMAFRAAGDARGMR